ncbi:transcription termination factor MTERF9, chloroplastic-like [Amaranthus tricolor]|uniref:transcription termination factor MTERF9, chloroplastic-like n=1 Tax=Amaranthus tricolor TaxID=29722 RepID=UPI002588A7DE|nr:transcription termination factor MTERF9, chloroplastic-like [Amaranthus tricolor]XP_057549693.1 transcription termination factor MTERF9, chloroplastic-like [Amaranthus tricolor]XP_057549696.1 transcription termination factor MTERF9, chloroplastic-like [Amaranthus tricolor]XP_057549697.1 transcription termination factor MTERF9, chloroplastic-like [Amaranthus tricolor]XP_057549698.1 transcription termination factor MTERF9, chloroplastic-like [Amaranthus tricolor]XP_057549699.1 transcription t
MLKLRSFCNGVQPLYFIQSFRHFQLFSTSTSNNQEFVNYLVESLGFSSGQALSISTKLARNRQTRGAKNFNDFNMCKNADSVVAYYTQIGVELLHIKNTICSVPDILLAKVDKNLKPKTEYFISLGFSGSDFVGLIKTNPRVLFHGLNTAIIPSIQALKEIMGNDYEVSLILKKSRQFRLNSVSKTLVPNVALLRNYGINIDLIRRQILKVAYPFFRNTKFFEDAVARVENKMGISRNSPKFMLGVHLLNCISVEKFESKIQIFKNFGWTELDIVTLCRNAPLTFALSEALIKIKLDFFMTKLGYESKDFSKKFFILGLSLDKRIVPRHKFLVVLKEKGFIKEYYFYSAMLYTESNFVKKFVLPFKEVHEVYCKQADMSLETLTVELSKLNSDAV